MCYRLQVPQRFFPITPPRQELPGTTCAFIMFFFVQLRALLRAPQVNEFKEDNAPARKHSTTAVAMMAIFGTVPKASSIEGSATGTPHGATAGPSTSGAIPVRDQSRANGEAAVEDNPWDGYNTARPDPPTKVKQKRGDEWICPEHGPMCIAGICTVRPRVDRDERWQKEREERAENKRKWKERKARKREMELARAEGRELPCRDQLAEVNGDGSHDQGAMHSLQQLPERRKEHLSNMYRTHQVRCASVLRLPTLPRLLRESVCRRLFRQREKDFLCQPTWAENTRSQSTVILRPGPRHRRHRGWRWD
jgi:hypothetical protein